MRDSEGPQLAQWFYEELFKNKSIGLDDIPYALDAAVQKLREKDHIPPHHWATYMHWGA